jgi:hypothetical protein
LTLALLTKSGERLKETVAEVLAGRLEGAVWKTIDDLSEDQIAGLLAGLPDVVKTLAEQPLDILGDAAGFPAPVVSLGADVTATLVLKPVLEPLQSAVHFLEVAGIVLGLATGMHPLVLTCVKHLAYDELGETLTHAFEQIMSPADARALAIHHQPDMEPVSARPGFDSGYIALCRLAESAAVSARPRSTAAAVDHDSASPQRRYPPITGILRVIQLAA